MEPFLSRVAQARFAAERCSASGTKVRRETTDDWRRHRDETVSHENAKTTSVHPVERQALSRGLKR